MGNIEILRVIRTIYWALFHINHNQDSRYFRKIGFLNYLSLKCVRYYEIFEINFTMKLQFSVFTRMIFSEFPPKNNLNYFPICLLFYLHNFLQQFSFFESSMNVKLGYSYLLRIKRWQLTANLKYLKLLHIIDNELKNLNFKKPLHKSNHNLIPLYDPIIYRKDDFLPPNNITFNNLT